tara:strand:+ start:193 stop:435 length:243 start_codon:yes stop_codon:yes gene_type:complete
MTKRKIDVENIPDLEGYYNRLDEDKDGMKMVLEYQMDMINKLWKSMVTLIIGMEESRWAGYSPAMVRVEPLFNIKGDEEE